jgi:hypothetical protein
VLGRAGWRDIEIQAVETQSAPDVWVPAWFYAPTAPGAILLLLEPGSRNARWAEGGLYQTLAAKGHPVLVPNLRGIDDLRPEFGRGAVRYTRPHNDEEHYAWASLMLGKPLLGQRVTDILALVAAVGRPVHIAALEHMTVPALCAAALDRRIERLHLVRPLVSFEDLAGREDYRHPFANFVPSLLRHTDLPEIAASIAPRKITLAGAVDGAESPVREEKVREIYRSAANIPVRADAAWTADALLAD